MKLKLQEVELNGYVVWVDKRRLLFKTDEMHLVVVDWCWRQFPITMSLEGYAQTEGVVIKSIDHNQHDRTWLLALRRYNGKSTE